jgi:hypothetical protein
MNSDFRELLQCFAKHRGRYLVVGGYAVNHYSQPRYTKDLDLWIEPTAANARKVAIAFYQFGIPLIGITEEDLAQPSTQFMLGRAPVMFDFLTSIPPLDFVLCWAKRKRVRHDFASVNYFSRHRKKGDAGFPACTNVPSPCLVPGCRAGEVRGRSCRLESPHHPFCDLDTLALPTCASPKHMPTAPKT